MQETLNQRPTSKWWAYTAIGLGTFTSVVDHGSVVVALPTIAKHFGTDIPTVQWVLVGYILAISALLLPIGRLSDIVGRKRVYIGGFVIFLLGAAVAGSAPNVGIMIVGRIIQGAGAAMSQATGLPQPRTREGHWLPYQHRGNRRRNRACRRGTTGRCPRLAMGVLH